MTTKPASLAEHRPETDDRDPPPSASARFRLKMTPDGQLVPEIVPVDGEDDSEGSKED